MCTISEATGRRHWDFFLNILLINNFSFCRQGRKFHQIKCLDLLQFNLSHVPLSIPSLPPFTFPGLVPYPRSSKLKVIYLVSFSTLLTSPPIFFVFPSLSSHPSQPEEIPAIYRKQLSALAHTLKAKRKKNEYCYIEINSKIYSFVT